MEDVFSLLPAFPDREETLRELRRASGQAEQFGLYLSEGELAELTQEREQALAGAGRMEFGGGILPELIHAFCDSPYVESESWAETLAQLQEAFYYFKSESEDRFTDGELVEFMVSVFNGPAQGSLDYLTGTSLDALARLAREGRDGRGELGGGGQF